MDKNGIPWTQKEQGRHPPRCARKGSLVLAGGKLVLLSETGKLVIAEPSGAAHQPLAEAQVLGGRCWITPVLSGGHIYVRKAAGEVVCLDVRAKDPQP